MEPATALPNGSLLPAADLATEVATVAATEEVGEGTEGGVEEASAAEAGARRERRGGGAGWGMGKGRGGASSEHTQPRIHAPQWRQWRQQAARRATGARSFPAFPRSLRVTPAPRRLRRCCRARRRTRCRLRPRARRG